MTTINDSGYGVIYPTPDHLVDFSTGEVKVNREIGSWGKPARQQAFADANAAYYRTVDWALDISEAEFIGADLDGVPARLIRRDPASQVVITREKTLEGRWRQLDLSATHWATRIACFLRAGHPDLVLVAPKRSRSYRRLLEGLQRLRDAGVAEPE
jgi:hypothetical protein